MNGAGRERRGEEKGRGESREKERGEIGRWGEGVGYYPGPMWELGAKNLCE